MEKHYSYNLEVKSLNNYSFEGYASVFNKIDAHQDILQKGAFGMLDPRKIKLLWQHHQDEPIGVIDEIYEDNHGLYVKAKISALSQRGKEAYHLMQMGAIGALSIGFNIEDYNFTQSGARLIKAVKLFEVSLVTFPANDEAIITSVKARMLAQNECTKGVQEIQDSAKRVIQALWKL